MCHESFVLKSSTVHQRSHFKIYKKKKKVVLSMKIMSTYHFLQHKYTKQNTGSMEHTESKHSIQLTKLSRANSCIRLLNGEYTNASRTSSHYLRGEELYNYNVSPLRIYIYIYPNPWLTVGGDLEPGVRAVYSI